MRAAVSRVAMLALAAVIWNAAGTDAGHAQGVTNQGVTKPTFTKQAFDINTGLPLTGPVAVGQAIQYVLSFSSGTLALNLGTIDDTLTSNLAYVNASLVMPPDWTANPSAPYSVGNHTQYSNPGFGPGTSFILNVPVAQLGQAGTSAGDGFYPIPVGNNVDAIFHHEILGSAQINCWNLLSLLQCPGYPKSLDTSLADQHTTPQTVRTVVIGPLIYYPSAHYDLSSNKTFIGIGCWNTAGASGTGAPCQSSFIPLPSNPFLIGKYEGNVPVSGTSLYSLMAGVVAEPNSSRLFIYALNKVECVDVSVPNAPVACTPWSPPTLGGGGAQWLDIMVGENLPASPTKIYVHYGTTGTNNRTTIACLNASDGTRCGSPWLATDPQATLTTAQSRYGMLSPAFNTAGVMTGVCASPYVGAPPGNTMICFDANVGSVTPVPVSSNFVNALGSVNVVTAFHIPNTLRVLYARYQDATPVSCFDFATDGLCSPFAPPWSNNIPPPSGFEDYGYAVDPAEPDHCLLGLGNQGRLWRFARDGSFGPNGCVQRVEQTFDINSFFCAIKPKQVTWDSLVIRNPRPTELAGGTVNLINSANAIVKTITVLGAPNNSYPVNIQATGANSQLTVQFIPTYSPNPPPNGYQLELTFTADVAPQICYQATVQACGPVANKASMAGSLAGPAPIPFSAAANIDLGDATGPGCAAALLKVCKVAGPGIAVGTPFIFTATGSPSFSVPAGPPPGGTCVIGPKVTAGTTVAVVETIPPGDTVSDIIVAPPGQLVAGTTNLPGGSVNVLVGSGVTEVTFKNKRTGFLEICKIGDVQGIFTINPGSLGPFVVPPGACSSAIEVAAGPALISEQLPGGFVLTGCSTIPANQQGTCDNSAQTSTVTVVPGDISTQTIAIITNRRRRGIGGEAPRVP